jgi:UDP:flavonoid glycosyltransferase YjiC (YdhE family)
MSSGTPFIGIPLHPEQELNVHLAARHGAALGVARRHARGPRLTQAVQRLQVEPGFRTAAKKLQAMYAGQDAPRAAARAILQDLRRQLAEPTAG